MHEIEKNKWQIVNEILMKYFPNKTLGITTRNDALKIFFNERKNLKKDKEKIKISIDIIFADNKINKVSFPFISKINKIIGKKIGYVDSHDEMIYKGNINIDFNINFDKVDDFKKIIKNLVGSTLKTSLSKINNKYNLPLIKKININKGYE